MRHEHLDGFRNEFDYAEELCKRIENEVLRARVANLLGWYMSHAKRNKKWFLGLSFVTILLPIAIGSINLSQQPTETGIVTAILSGLVSLASSAIVLFRFRDHWTQYRCCAERIKSESVQYCSGACEQYANSQTKDIVFLNQIEKIAAEENGNWSKEESKKSSDDCWLAIKNEPLRRVTAEGLFDQAVYLSTGAGLIPQTSVC